MTSAIALQGTLAQGSASRPGDAVLSILLPLLIKGHREQLRVLGAPSPAASSGSTTSVASAAALIRDELDAAAHALADAQLTSPSVAALLVRIAAGWAVNADLLARAARLPAAGGLRTAAVPSATPSSSPSTQPLDAATRGALGDLLAGEHAAVFAYGMVTARVVTRDRAQAMATWRLHVVLRDRYRQSLLDGGAQPPAARPAYDVDPPATDPAGATALAGRVESGLVMVAVSAVAATTGQIRADAAAQAVAAARRSAAWTGRVAALPG